MANVLVEETSLTAIANSIRTKNSSTDTYTPSEMATAIDALEVGGITPTGTISVTANGTYDVTEYASAEVSVEESVTLGTKSITANGTYTASDDSYDGYSEVTAAVPASAVDSGTKSISITANGTTTEDVTGYASAEITVNVSSGGSSLESGTFTGDGSTTLTISVSSEPSHLAVWTIDDNFGTDTTWNLFSFIYDSSDTYFFQIYRYSSSNVNGARRTVSSSISYANSTITIKLNYGTRSGVTYNWISW